MRAGMHASEQGLDQAPNLACYNTTNRDEYMGITPKMRYPQKYPAQTMMEDEAMVLDVSSEGLKN
jgi:hypothetical protein